MICRHNIRVLFSRFHCTSAQVSVLPWPSFCWALPVKVCLTRVSAFTQVICVHSIRSLVYWFHCTSVKLLVLSWHSLLLWASSVDVRLNHVFAVNQLCRHISTFSYRFHRTSVQLLVLAWNSHFWVDWCPTLIYAITKWVVSQNVDEFARVRSAFVFIWLHNAAFASYYYPVATSCAECFCTHVHFVLINIFVVWK